MFRSLSAPSANGSKGSSVSPCFDSFDRLDSSERAEQTLCRWLWVYTRCESKQKWTPLSFKVNQLESELMGHDWRCFRTSWYFCTFHPLHSDVLCRRKNTEKLQSVSQQSSRSSLKKIFPFILFCWMLIDVKRFPSLSPSRISLEL